MPRFLRKVFGMKDHEALAMDLDTSQDINATTMGSI
jgi:hypothetical protein